MRIIINIPDRPNDEPQPAGELLVDVIRQHAERMMVDCHISPIDSDGDIDIDMGGF